MKTEADSTQAAEAEREHLHRIHATDHHPVNRIQAENERLRDLLSQARETLASGTPYKSHVIAAIDAVLRHSTPMAGEDKI